MAGCRHCSTGKERMAEPRLQGTTYARALFYSNWTRTFALVIGVNHKSRGIRFMFFHRGGMASRRRENLRWTATNPCSQNSSGLCAQFSAGATQRRQASFQLPHPIAHLEVLLNSRVVLAYEGVQIELQFCRERRRAVQYHRPHPHGLKMVQTCEDPHATKRLHAECAYHLPAKCHHRDPRGQRVLLPRERRAPPPRRCRWILPLPGNATIDTGKNTSLVGASPNDVEALADACAIYSFGSLEFTNTNHGGIPAKVVTKDSWPVGCSIELETYSTSSGQFGLPVLW